MGGASGREGGRPPATNAARALQTGPGGGRGKRARKQVLFQGSIWGSPLPASLPAPPPFVFPNVFKASSSPLPRSSSPEGLSERTFSVQDSQYCSSSGPHPATGRGGSRGWGTPHPGKLTIVWPRGRPGWSKERNPSGTWHPSALPSPARLPFPPSLPTRRGSGSGTAGWTFPSEPLLLPEPAARSVQ